MAPQRRGGGREIPRLFRAVGLEHQIGLEARHPIIILGTLEGFRTSRDEAAEGGGGRWAVRAEITEGDGFRRGPRLRPTRVQPAVHVPLRGSHSGAATGQSAADAHATQARFTGSQRGEAPEQSASVRQDTQIPAVTRQKGAADPAAQTASSPHEAQIPF